MGNPRRFTEPAATLHIGERRTLEISTEWPVESIVSLCEAIFQPDATEVEVGDAMRAVQALLEELIDDRTEHLRGALINMVNAHHKRSALSGNCACKACLNAVEVLSGQN